MNLQEQRKRAFSQAFQRMIQPRLSDNSSQPAKRISSYPFDPPDLYQQRLSQPNETFLDLQYDSTCDQNPGTHLRDPITTTLQYATPVQYNYTSLQHGLYGNAPEIHLEAGAGSFSPTPVRDYYLEGTVLGKSSLLTPVPVLGQLICERSAHLDPGSGSPLAKRTGLYAAKPGAGPAHCYGGSVSDMSTATEPLTPSALNFDGLSLNSQGYSIPSSTVPSDVQSNRTTVKTVPACSVAKHFSQISPNEVVITYDRGKRARKLDKCPLCNASRFFSEMLHGPFLDQGLVRCIRLRGDFPYAINTMLHFIETGHYMFDQHALTDFPLLTTLDLHVHAYLVGNKYEMIALKQCAIDAYLGIAEDEMRLGFMELSFSQLSDIRLTVAGFPVMVRPIDRFLNSLVLLWKNTQSRNDALRNAVLELIKHNLNKLLRVPFFVTLLQEMIAFGDEVVASLEDDGLEVQAFQAPVGGRLSQTIRFSG